VASRITRFATELKRRKVYHVGVVYLVVGFAVAQGAEYLFQLLEFPLAAAQFVAILIAITGNRSNHIPLPAPTPTVDLPSRSFPSTISAPIRGMLTSPRACTRRS